MQPKPFASDVADVFRRSRFNADSIDVPEIDRGLYARVKAAIEGLGGRWDRKRATHVFRQDPSTLVTEDRSAPLNGGMTFDSMREALKTGVKVIAVPQLFPTPPDVAKRAAEMAGIENAMRVLEPEAGTGNLIEAIMGCVDEGAVEVLAVEINQNLADALRGRWSGVRVLCCDFLDMVPPAQTFDRAVMNPPFERGADIKHVEHALKFLRPGGRLVAIVAGGARQEKAFRHRASEWEELPSGTFAGTGVRAVLMAIDKEQP
jgi:predicted RNA methylase